MEAAEGDRDKLRAAVLQAQVQADELIAALKSLAAERDAAAAAAAAARAEAERLRQHPGACSAAAAELPLEQQVLPTSDSGSRGVLPLAVMIRLLLKEGFEVF